MPLRDTAEPMLLLFLALCSCKLRLILQTFDSNESTQQINKFNESKPAKNFFETKSIYFAIFARMQNTSYLKVSALISYNRQINCKKAYLCIHSLVGLDFLLFFFMPKSREEISYDDFISILLLNK